ncbi:unnamed protein product [Heterobilharzia americana]|nr:unnamed protein product [Heterobilharzia americana]
MKQRHLEGDTHPLSVEEILEEAVLHDTPPATIKWLEEEALPNNPKIRVTEDSKFVFRPRYNIRTRKDLYQLFRRQELKGLGGIYLDDLTESIPDVEKILSVGKSVRIQFFPICTPPYEIIFSIRYESFKRLLEKYLFFWLFLFK